MAREGGREGGPSMRETSPPALISVQESICGINIWQDTFMYDLKIVTKIIT